MPRRSKSSRLKIKLGIGMMNRKITSEKRYMVSGSLCPLKLIHLWNQVTINKAQQANDGSLGILSTLSKFRTFRTFSNVKFGLPQLFS